MPELPEVARTANSLHEAMSEKNIVDVKIHSGRYSRHGAPEGFNTFLQNLPVLVRAVTFRGKFICITSSNPKTKNTPIPINLLSSISIAIFCSSYCHCYLSSASIICIYHVHVSVSIIIERKGSFSHGCCNLRLKKVWLIN